MTKQEQMIAKKLGFTSTYPMGPFGYTDNVGDKLKAKAAKELPTMQLVVGRSDKPIMVPIGDKVIISEKLLTLLSDSEMEAFANNRIEEIRQDRSLGQSLLAGGFIGMLGAAMVHIMIERGYEKAQADLQQVEDLLALQKGRKPHKAEVTRRGFLEDAGRIGAGGVVAAVATRVGYYERAEGGKTLPPPGPALKSALDKISGWYRDHSLITQRERN